MTPDSPPPVAPVEAEPREQQLVERLWMRVEQWRKQAAKDRAAAKNCRKLLLRSALTGSADVHDGFANGLVCDLEWFAGLASASSAAPSVAEGWAKVTRFEVIGQGREYTRYRCRVEPSFQDDGRTLKVFIKDAPQPSVSPATETEQDKAAPPQEQPKKPRANICAAHGVDWCEVCLTDEGFKRPASTEPRR